MNPYSDKIEQKDSQRTIGVFDFFSGKTKTKIKMYYVEVLFHHNHFDNYFKKID